MSSPYVGEIRLFAGSFAPQGWLFCDGQTLPISENDVLFNLIGTTYGGDGQDTFQLPDLRSRVPVSVGQPPGGSTYVMGQSGGVETVTLTANQLPPHRHALMTSAQAGTTNRPGGNLPAVSPSVRPYVEQDPVEPADAAVVLPTGGSQPHDNMQPFLAVHYIISLYGIYPTQQ